jgi:MFS transporter, putative metabolite:H+ symporter
MAAGVRAQSHCASRNAGEQPVSRERLLLRVLFTGTYRRRTVMAWVLNGLEVIGADGFGTVAPLVWAAKGYSIVAAMASVVLNVLALGPRTTGRALETVTQLTRRQYIATASVRRRARSGARTARHFVYCHVACVDG